MIKQNISPDSAEQKLASCSVRQEAWKSDHHNAMQLYSFEDFLGDMVELYDEIEKFDRFFRHQVSTSPNDYCEHVDKRLKSLCAKYLDLMNDIEHTTLNLFDEYRDVENRKEFLDRLEKARNSSAYDFDLEAEIDFRSKLPQIEFDSFADRRTPIEDWPL